jgi:tetratricopeptide (TPR) repeat protein
MDNTTLAFGYNSTEDSLVIVMLLDEPVVIGWIFNDYFFNMAKSNHPSWKNDTVFISSEMPYRAALVSFEFVWDKNSEFFIATEPQTYDPSWEAVNKADSLLLKGDLRGAINNYYQVMYPHAYMNEGEVGISLLKCAHEKALKFFNEQKYDSAVAYMDMALDFYPNSNYVSFNDKTAFDTQMSDSATWQQPWTMDHATLWLGDYGLFLYKAKKYAASIEFNSYLNMILPEMAGPFLQLGDSYYDSGKKAEAKTAYKKYSDLKKAQKKEKDIPKRIKERMK